MSTDPLLNNNHHIDDDDDLDDDDDGVVVANRRRQLSSQIDTLTARQHQPQPTTDQSPAYSSELESMQSGKVSIEREGDTTSLVHFATGQAVIEAQVDSSGVREAFFTDRSIAMIEQDKEHELQLDADRAIAVALLGRNSQRRRRNRDSVHHDDSDDDPDVPRADAELVPLQSSPPRSAIASSPVVASVAAPVAAPLTKLDAMQLLKTMQACDLITPQCRQFYTRKLVNTTVAGESDGALALMAAFGDNLAELAAELHTYADLPPPNIQIFTTTAASPTATAMAAVSTTENRDRDSSAPRRRRSSGSARAAKEKSRPPSGPPSIMKRSSSTNAAAVTATKNDKPTAKQANVGSGRLRVRFAEVNNNSKNDNNDDQDAAAAGEEHVDDDDDDESGDPLDKARAPAAVADDGKKKKSKKMSKKKHHHRGQRNAAAARYAPVSAAARANANMFRIDAPQTNAAFDERLMKIMNDL
jgi:hypothetical protein